MNALPIHPSSFRLHLSKFVTHLGRDHRAARVHVYSDVGCAWMFSLHLDHLQAVARVVVGLLKPGDGQGVTVLAAGIGIAAGMIARGKALHACAETVMSRFVRAEEIDRIEVHGERSAGKSNG